MRHKLRHLLLGQHNMARFPEAERGTDVELRSKLHSEGRFAAGNTSGRWRAALMCFQICIRISLMMIVTLQATVKLINDTVSLRAKVPLSLSARPGRRSQFDSLRCWLLCMEPPPLASQLLHRSKTHPLLVPIVLRIHCAITGEPKSPLSQLRS